MRVAILSANLGEFDTTPIDPPRQYLPSDLKVEELNFHRFTDTDFPPITGLTPRLQYRIPKLFGWDMKPDYDVYIWLDSSMSLESNGVEFLVRKLGKNDCAFFLHPWRNTIQQEVEHIEDHLQRGKSYIVSRYKNGLHKEFLEVIKEDKNYKDDTLFASNVFIYRNSDRMQYALQVWWYYQSRYFTCDQVQLPFALYEAGAKVSKIDVDVFKNDFISLVSKHK